MICPPAKRQKLNSEMSGQTFEDEESEILDLDPNGEGFKSRKSFRFQRREYDTCEMVLTRDINEVKQLYNCYGKFNNTDLLGVYGFIDTKCQIDTISFRYQLFDLCISAVNPYDRCEYWSYTGYKLLEEIAQHSSQNQRELEIIHDRHECPEKGDDFVKWSLAIGQHGWITFPLKVWSLILLCSAEDWFKFKAMSLEEQCKFILPMIEMFEGTDEIKPEQLNLYHSWLKLMACVLEHRHASYQDAAQWQQFKLAYLKYSSYRLGAVNLFHKCTNVDYEKSHGNVVQRTGESNFVRVPYSCFNCKGCD
jgi:hypothetical protein